MKERFFFGRTLWFAMALIYTENYGPSLKRSPSFTDGPRGAVDRGGLDLKDGQLKENPIKAFKARRSAKYFPLRNKIRKLDYSLLDNPQDGIERQMPHLR